MTEHKLNSLNQELAELIRQYDSADHSIFSPSGSAMWANCSGSLIPNLFAKDTAGEDAAEGTVAHAVGEEWLRTGECPEHLLGAVRKIEEGDQTFEIEIDGSMMEYVEQYVDWCIYLPGNHFVETRVDFSDLTPIKRQRGTADHAACEPGRLTITDLKYGKGVQVFAEENTQALLYAYGFFKQYDELFEFQEIVIRIAQPRLDHFDEWVITRDTLLERAAWLKERAHAAWCKDAERKPGAKQCQWCKVKKDCAAYAVFAERMVDGIFEDLDSPVTASDISGMVERMDDGTFNLRPVDKGSLTVAQKALLLPYRKMVEGWFADIAEDLEQRAINGEMVPGYKVVAGKSNRVFTSDDDAVRHLEFLGLPDDVIHPKGMITPAKAETALTKIGYKRKQLPELLNRVVMKPPGKPTLAHESDKRPPIVMLASDSFENLDEEL